MRLISLMFLLALSASVMASDPFTLPSTLHYQLLPIKLRHIDSQLAIKQLQPLTAQLSSQSYLIEDRVQNTLWLYARQANAQRLIKLINKLDHRAARIAIHAKVVLLDQHSLQELGVLFTSHATQLPLLNLKNQQWLEIKLNALEACGKASILSAPSLIVNGGETASIASGEELPYQERSREGNTSVTFKNALLELKVKPKLLNDNTIRLVLNLHQDKPSQRLINGTPTVDTEQISTTADVANRQTLMLGGISERSLENNQRGIPGLSHLPLLGRLFQNHVVSRSHRRLVIFITPQVI